MTNEIAGHRRALLVYRSIITLLCLGAAQIFGEGRALAQYERDTVASRLVEIARRDAGQAVVAGQVETGRLTQGQESTRRYDLRPGRCYWFLAVGDGNIDDIDLIVRSRGVQLLRDQGTSREAVVPGGRPFCPRGEVGVQVQVVAFRGGGIYATALYALAVDSGDGSTDTRDVSSLLAAAGERYAPGMTPVGDPTVTRMAAGEQMSDEIRLDGGMCYRVIAVGGEGVADLDLLILQGSSQVAGDNAVASEAVASYCATTVTPVRIRLRMARGGGEVAFAVLSGGRQHGVGRGAVPGATNHPIGGAGDDYLARQIRAHHGRVGQDRRGASEVFRAELRTSQDRSFPVRLEAGRCYTFVAVGAPSVRDLDLYFLDPNGMELTSDMGPENHAVLETNPCPRWSGTYTLRLRVFAGYGQVAIQAFGN